MGVLGNRSKMPYKVTVTGKDNDMQVNIEPQPVAVKDEMIPVVAGRFQKVLMNPNIRNTAMGRAKLRKDLESVLEDYHKQGLIQPRKEKDEGIS